MGKGVHVSLIGHHVERVKELGQEVCQMSVCYGWADTLQVVKELDGEVVAAGRLGDDTPSAKV